MGRNSQALAGGDRGCGVICKRWNGSAVREVVARVSAPAPQLEAVRLATTQADRNNFRTIGGYTIGNVD